MSSSLQAVVQALKDKPRAVWVMLPAGRITEQTIAQLGELMDAGDIVIDGGNTILQGRCPAREDAGGEGHPLHRLRHLGRRVGARARLLPDDRRREGSGRSSRSDLCRVGAGRRHDRTKQRAMAISFYPVNGYKRLKVCYLFIEY